MKPQDSSLSPRARGLRALWGAGIACLIAALSCVTPQGLNPSTCLFREFTGISCLTCSLTRSLHASVHGDVLAAIHFHLLGPLCVAGMIIAAVVWMTEAFSGTRLIHDRKSRLRKYALAGILVVGLFYGVLRALLELVG